MANNIYASKEFKFSQRSSVLKKERLETERTYDSLKRRADSTMASRETMRAIFRTYDKDNSGSIDMAELKAVLRASYLALGMPIDEKKVIQRAKDMMYMADDDGSGTISFDEFCNAFQRMM